jgi:hypothetical protein
MSRITARTRAPAGYQGVLTSIKQFDADLFTRYVPVKRNPEKCLPAAAEQGDLLPFKDHYRTALPEERLIVERLRQFPGMRAQSFSSVPTDGKRK